MCARQGYCWALLVLLLLPGCQSSAINQHEGKGTVEFIAVYAEQAGVYELSPEIMQAAGWDKDNLENLRITNHGEEVDYWILEREGKKHILFWGEEYRSRYTQENVYLIEPAPDREGQILPNGLIQKAGTGDNLLISEASKLLVLEETRLYTPQITDGDPFGWEKMSAPAKKQVEFSVDHLSDGSGSLQLNVWASTGSVAPVDNKVEHHIIVKLNGQVILDEEFSGKGRHHLGDVILAGVLEDGANLLELELPGDSDALVDILLLDGIEITYPRNMVFGSEVEYFSGSGELLVVGLEEDSRGAILDISVPKTPKILYADVGQGFAFESTRDNRYVFVPDGSWVSQPNYRLVFTQDDLKSQDYRADYLVIGGTELLPGVEALLEHRRSQGLTAKAIPLEWIFDQFSFGTFDPQAIQDFLRFAFSHWSLPPKYVLLLGDFSYDPGGLISNAPKNMLPGFFVQTEYGGETISDAALVMLDGDGLPDIALGRIPASSIDEIQGAVNKIIQYEQQASAGSIEHQLLVVADTQEARFAYDAQEFAGWFTGALTVQIYDPKTSAQDDTEKLAGLFSEGYLFMTYFGHGSLSQWGKDAIFNSDAAAKLTNNDRLPVVINLTCLTGYYIHPKVRSLAENLLMNPEGGAVAMLAPSSLTLPDDQRAFSRPLAEAFVANPGISLGELFLQAQRSLPVDRSGTREVLLTYMLFGDPALKLPVSP